MYMYTCMYIHSRVYIHIYIYIYRERDIHTHTHTILASSVCPGLARRLGGDAWGAGTGHGRPRVLYQIIA